MVYSLCLGSIAFTKKVFLIQLHLSILPITNSAIYKHKWNFYDLSFYLLVKVTIFSSYDCLDNKIYEHVFLI